MKCCIKHVQAGPEAGAGLCGRRQAEEEMQLGGARVRQWQVAFARTKIGDFGANEC